MCSSACAGYSFRCFCVLSSPAGFRPEKMDHVIEKAYAPSSKTQEKVPAKDYVRGARAPTSSGRRARAADALAHARQPTDCAAGGDRPAPVRLVRSPADLDNPCGDAVSVVRAMRRFGWDPTHELPLRNGSSE